MKRFLSWLKKMLPSKKGNDSIFKKMMQMLAVTRDNELSCDEVYALLDQFAEAISRGEAVNEWNTPVGQHLKVCPDCREEFETLLAMIEAA